ncbi:GlxA family transcriptional regulator [Aquipseudomonas alcaligenes]|uniref:GlxA family transcriptional regulator n=1 Tax=Aquipseudomonas alcaligenes TaxID=43263 RepID=UPI003748C631
MKRVAILAFPGCWAMSLYSARDFFRIVALLEAHVGLGQGYAVEILSEDGSPVASASGPVIVADGALAAEQAYDLVIVPALEGPRIDELLAHSALTVTWLSVHLRRGAPLLALTTGSCLLAATGLVDGVLLASHWAYLRRLQVLFPRCRFTAHESYVQVDNVYSAGSLNGGFDALLALLSGERGNQFAQLCAAHLLVSEPRRLQPLLPGHRNHDDEAVLRVQEWVEVQHAEPLRIEHLARRFGFSERNLKRRFLAATGISPNQYLQRVRIDKAKKLLIATRMSVKEIAYEVGYENTSFFVRLFKRELGSTPARWRQAGRLPLV